MKSRAQVFVEAYCATNGYIAAVRHTPVSAELPYVGYIMAKDYRHEFDPICTGCGHYTKTVERNWELMLQKLIEVTGLSEDELAVLADISGQSR